MDARTEVRTAASPIGAAPNRGAGPRLALALAWVGLPLAAAAYQIAAKDAALDLRRVRLGPGLAPALMASHALWATVAFDFACFILWMIILARTSLAAAFPLTAVSYALVVLASVLIFHESLTLLEGIGSVLILVGVFLMSGPPVRTSE